MAWRKSLNVSQMKSIFLYMFRIKLNIYRHRIYHGWEIRFERILITFSNVRHVVFTKCKSVTKSSFYVGLNPNLVSELILQYFSHCMRFWAFIMNSLAKITCFRQKIVVFAKTSCFRCLVIPQF